MTEPVSPLDGGPWTGESLGEQVVDRIVVLIDAITRNGNVLMAKTELLRVLVTDGPIKENVALRTTLEEARSLLDYALSLRMYGESPPGHPDLKQQTWDQRAEAFLRDLLDRAVPDKWVQTGGRDHG